MSGRSQRPRKLIDLQILRHISEALREGIPAADIEKELKLRQDGKPWVERVIDTPALVDRSPAEVIWQRTAGDITHRKMMSELMDWPFTFARPLDDPDIDGAMAGPWDQVLDWYRAGYVTDDELEALQNHIRPPADSRYRL